MSSCQLIVHADDFGITEAANEGIVRAHREGIVTSTSLMAPGAAFEHAIRLSRLTPELDVGIHLTLVEEKPLLPPQTIPSLVTESGHFFNHATTFMKHYLQGRIRMEEVYRELDAQIAKVKNQGIPFSHLDSHQHVHMLPRVRQVVIELARKYGIRAMRRPREPLRGYMLKKWKNYSRIPQLLVLNTLCRLAGNRDIPGAEHFAGFYYGGNLNKKNLLNVLRNLPSTGTCELMCHPGNADPDGRYGHWGYHWGEELNALIDPDVFVLLRRRDIELISYRKSVAHAHETT